MDKSVRIVFNNTYNGYSNTGSNPWWNLVKMDNGLITAATPTLYTFSSLFDDTHATTAMGLSTLSGYNGCQSIASPAITGGLYDSAIVSSMLQVGTTGGSFKLTGLIQGKVYQVYIMQGAGTNLEQCNYTINSVTKTGVANINGENSGYTTTEYDSRCWVVFNNIAPTTGGEILLTFTKGAGGGYQSGMSCIIVRQSTLS